MVHPMTQKIGGIDQLPDPKNFDNQMFLQSGPPGYDEGKRTYDNWGRERGMVFNTTFNNISVISWQSVFIGGGNQSTQRKPPTCQKSLTNFLSHNVVSSTLRHQWGSNSQL